MRDDDDGVRDQQSRPIESIFRTVRVDSQGELEHLRERTSRVLTLFVCFNVPLAAVVAIVAGIGVEAASGLALVFALASVALVPTAARSSLGRMLMAAVAVGAAILVVSIAHGYWHGDWFAYVFVTFALLVGYSDWRPIALAAVLAMGYVQTSDAARPTEIGATAFDHTFVQLLLIALASAALGVIARELLQTINRTEAALSAREIFESIVVTGNAGIGVFSGDDARTLAYANPTFTLQLAHPEPIGQTARALAEAGPELICRVCEELEGRAPGAAPICASWTSGDDERWVEIDAFPIVARTGTPYVVAVTNDVTTLRAAEIEVARARIVEEINHSLEREIADRKAAERKLEHAAYHDVLTGLPNRMLLYERLELALRRSGRLPERGPAVLFIDLDGFKMVNDNFGHTVADLLLVSVARRFEASLRADDTIARIGGDEFLVLLENVSESAAVALANVLIDELRKPFELAERKVSISASIGIAVGTDVYTDADMLVRDADVAMYRAKTTGKGRCDIFVDEMRVRSDRRTRFGIDLKHALDRDEFTVHYQPIVSLVTGGLEGFEALVRWQHPALGLVAPGDFIAVAEETGDIVGLGAWVLFTACSQLAAWRRELPKAGRLTISVNVSANQLLTSGFARTVHEVLAETRLPASALHLEITETAVVHEPLRVAHELVELRRAGISISMDDFGTGYSSLTYLKAFTVDSLKIDKSFVSDRGNAIGDPEIVRSLIVLAQSLGLGVVAEGVETPEQEAQLRELGCTKAQGYLFARPLTSVAATAFISGVPLALDIA